MRDVGDIFSLHILELDHELHHSSFVRSRSKFDRSHYSLRAIEIRLVLEQVLPLDNTRRGASEEERLTELVLNHQIQYCKIVDLLGKDKTLPLVE